MIGASSTAWTLTVPVRASLVLPSPSVAVTVMVRVAVFGVSLMLL